MTTTIEDQLEALELTRIKPLAAPPEEASSTEWWVHATRFASDVVSMNMRAFTESPFLGRPSVQVYERSIVFGAYSLFELRCWMAMLPTPKKWTKDSDGKPRLRATVEGWNLELVRYDLTCNLVETGEYEEVEVEEVIEPAKKKTVTKRVPVTITECPSMLAE